MFNNVQTIFHDGLYALQHPVMPLVRIVQLLFLTGPFDTIAQVIEELIDPIETETATYANPRELLHQYLPELKTVELLKTGGQPPAAILDSESTSLDLFQAVEAWVSQQIVTRELESINSMLCSPCQCDLCCIGPSADMTQDFFEIPLHDQEADLFPVSRIDTPQTRKTTPYADSPLLCGDTAFYDAEKALYRWQSGWSLILPRFSTCPHLAPDKKCLIYPTRPEVCRRPQIFCYVLEEIAGRQDKPTYSYRNTLLAVWDCPYVRELQNEIAAYAAASGLEIIFKQNKQ